MFSSEFSEIFQSSFLIEFQWASTSDQSMKFLKLPKYQWIHSLEIQCIQNATILVKMDATNFSVGVK